MQQGQVEKSCEIQMVAKKWLWWYVSGKKFNIDNSGELCAISYSEARMRKHKFTWIVVKILPS